MVSKVIKTAFSKIEDAVRVGKKYATGAYDKLPNNIVKLLRGVDNYRPVYKVQVTYPAYKDGELVAESITVADTSTSTLADVLKKKIGFGVSEIIGMWVDTSDSEEPDKCMVLFRVDPELAVKSVRGEATPLDDDYFMFSEVFALHNWIDIWIGYQKVFDADIISKNTIPDNFEWGSDTHVFSGRIVLADRNWDINGDRMIISAYSAEEIFFNHATYMSEESPRTLKISNIEGENIRNLRYYKDGMMELFSSIISVSDWEIKRERRREEREASGESEQTASERLEFYFVVGDFYWLMIEEGINKIITMLDGGAKKIDQVVKINQEYPPLDKYINYKIFTEDSSFKMKAPLVVSGKNITFWKALKMMLLPEYSNASGIGFRVIKNRDFKAKIPIPLTVNDGTNKHKGMWFQFFYELDVDEITEIVDKLSSSDRGFSKKTNFNNIVPPEDIQQITFGLDIIDFEAYMDYTSSFNSFKIMTPTYKRSNNVRPDYKGGSEFVFPLEHQDVIERLFSSTDTDKIGEFWNNVLQDIRLFGERRFPVTKWFSYSPDDVEAIRASITESQIIDVITNVVPPTTGDVPVSSTTKKVETYPINEEILKIIIDPSVDIKDIVGHKGIAHMFRRYYFGGLEGTAIVVGNPSLKAHRVLEVRDIRHGLNIGVSAGFKRDPDELAEKIYDKVKLQHRKKIRGVEPIDLKTKFDPDYIKKYFIWKTRHYYGINSGYITKVYFTQSRSKAWRMVSRDTMGTLKQAQRIRDEIT